MFVIRNCDFQISRSGMPDVAIGTKRSLGHDRVYLRLPVNQLTIGMNTRYNSRNGILAEDGLKYLADNVPCA